jgi:trans-aconitate methyltransferase
MKLDKYQKQWNRLGTVDPLWAVISHPSKKGGGWDEASFFATGDVEIDQQLRELNAVANTTHLRRALDFGCGVGRLTRALALRFRHVIGIDISASMIARAGEMNRAIANIEFILNTEPHLGILADSSVDLVYSNITLQHITSQLQQTYVKEFCRVLSPGGLMIFQLPSHHDLKSIRGIIHAVCGNPIMNVARRLLYGKDRVMEMHTLPRVEVEALLQKHDVNLLKVKPDNAAGPGFISYRYYAQRR